MKLRIAVLTLAIVSTPALCAQTQSTPAGTAPVVPSASLLAQLEQTAQTTNLDIAKLRIEKWKGDSDYKQQLQANADSLSRNISAALPAMMAQVRTSPESLAANFKLYRNLDALYDVLNSLAEAAGAHGPKNDYQALATDAATIDAIRRSLAERLEALALAKDAELARARGQGTGKSASGSGVKKIVIDDNEPARKTTRKKRSTSSPQ